MDWLLLIPTITLTGYLAYIWRTFGILPSISDSYRHIKQKWLFTLVLWSISFPVIIVGSDPLLFFAGVGIAFVGAAPKFWQDLEGKVHVAGAIGGIALGTIWTIFSGFWWLGVPFIVFAALVGLKVKGKYLIKINNHTWWVEVAAFAMILIALLLR